MDSLSFYFLEPTNHRNFIVIENKQLRILPLEQVYDKVMIKYLSLAEQRKNRLALFLNR